MIIKMCFRKSCASVVSSDTSFMFYAVYRRKERGAECQLSEVCPNLDDFACYSKILSMDEKLLFIT